VEDTHSTRTSWGGMVDDHVHSAAPLRVCSWEEFPFAFILFPDLAMARRLIDMFYHKLRLRCSNL
jgi:hypothetical protein